MKIFQVLCLMILINGQFLMAQKTHKSMYKHLLAPGSKLVRSSYNHTVEKTIKKDFIYKQYYPEIRQLTHLITYKTAAFHERHGESSEWFDNGQLLRTGHYVDNKREGEWKECYFGKTCSIGKYKNGRRDGKWIGLDSLGRMNGQWFYENGQKEGILELYDKEGTVTRKALYKKGELMEILIGEEGIGKDSLIQEVEQMPMFPGCEWLEGSDEESYKKCATKKMLMHIYKNINYPEVARMNGVEGQALIRFIINEKGEMKEIKVLRGVCDAIKTECQKVVKSMPNWRPGSQNGKPVKVYFNLPIKFKLE